MQGGCGEVTQAVMPKGVEHPRGKPAKQAEKAVTQAVMPKGVEHNWLRAALTAAVL